MLLKLGIDISRLSDPVRSVLTLIEAVHQRHKHEAVITSTYEGNHSPSSLHYVNRAIDLRLSNKPIHSELQKLLIPKGFDVVIEKDHVHIEYDPSE